MKTVHEISLGIEESLEEKLELLSPGFGTYRLLRKSVDARPEVPCWVLSVEVYPKGESPVEETYPVTPVRVPSVLLPVLIVGAGPAGLFAALRLTERGVPCKLIEQGSIAAKRMKSIANHWRYGQLDPKNNVCFGEGGAGLYSDGKLITRIKSPHIPYVLQRLVQFGAPAEIQYLSNPHVGSDKIRRVIPPIREFLKSKGCEIFFDTTVSALKFQGDRVTGVILSDSRTMEGSSVILATGHSSTSILHHLHESGVTLEGKSFAIGLRVEHPQKDIDTIQYRSYAGDPRLGAANYRLADHDHQSGVGVYSFCMCPGGYVISSTTEPNGTVSNGMSNYARNSPFANAAVVVSVDHASYFKRDIFGGLNLRTELEKAAYAQVVAGGGTKEFPVQRVVDFMTGRRGEILAHSSPSGAVPARLDLLLPDSIRNRLRSSLETFQRKMPGFLSERAQFFGVETRTSCPVRVVRDPNTLQSVSHPGLYPTGEGAGYAGGITSAAVDGVRVAEAIVESLGSYSSAPESTLSTDRS